MEFEKLLFFGVIFLYSLGTFGILIGTLAMRPPLKRAAHFITLTGFILHSLALVLALTTHGYTNLPVATYTQIFAWCFIVLYLIAWRWLRYPFLGLTAAPLALLLYILSVRLGGVYDILPEHLSGLFFGLHIWSLYISIGLLGMAFGAGLLFTYTEKRIKNKMPLAGFTRDMPSLAVYDKVNAITVVAGFPLYTLGLMSGFIWAPMTQSVMENPKVLLSLFVWFLYSLLFYQRAALGYRGRKTAVMAIAIFAVCALSFGLDYTVSHHSKQLLP